MRPGARHWTPYDDRELIAAWTGDGDMRKVAREINRTYQACVSRISQLRRADPSIGFRNPAGRVRG